MGKKKKKKPTQTQHINASKINLHESVQFLWKSYCDFLNSNLRSSLKKVSVEDKMFKESQEKLKVKNLKGGFAWTEIKAY